MNAHKNKDVITLMSVRTDFIDLLETLEGVLASNQHFLLGKWIEQAKSIPGASSEEAKLYEINAKNQITLWGPHGEIKDYAAKQWSGMVEDYYLPR